MPYVRNKLTWGSERLYHVLKPLLPEDWKPGRGKYKQQEMEDIFGRVKKEAENPHKTGTMEIFRIYHDLVKPRIPELRDCTNRLITSQSVNRTEENRLFGLEAYPSCTDPFAHWSVLYEKIMNGVERISGDWNEKFPGDRGRRYESEIYHPVGPFLFPFRFRKRERFEMAHVFQDAVLEANERASNLGLTARLGTTVRRAGDNDPQYGSYEFSEMLFMPSSARRAHLGVVTGYGFDARFAERSLIFLPDRTRELFERFFRKFVFAEGKMNILPKKQERVFSPHYEEVLAKSTHLNREMAWAAIENAVYRPLGLERAELIAMESSYARQIIPEERATTWKLMENTDFPIQKEAEDSSVNRILGGIWNGWLKERM